MTKVLIAVAIAVGSLYAGSAERRATSSAAAPSRSTVRLSTADIRDRVRGGWAGAIIGGAWGAPTEFQYTGRTIPAAEVPAWNVPYANHYQGHNGGADETYVEIPFLAAMLRHGALTGWRGWGAAFRHTRFRLYAANLQARQNLRRGIAAPASGAPGHNPYAYDIDFQIESDFAGMIAPAQPRAAIDIAWRLGHVMNYGDGVYGGVMVAAMHAAAFHARHVAGIVAAGRRSVPVGSSYRQMIDDVLRWHRRYPNSWTKPWQRLETKWNASSPAVKRDPRYVQRSKNIDARLNGAYILLGLLYGRGDFERTLTITMRAGQDSDCNPNNAASIIGTFHGFSGIPRRFTRGLSLNRNLTHTHFTLNDAIKATIAVAGDVTRVRGGRTDADSWTIVKREPAAPILEQWPLQHMSRPRLVAARAFVGSARSVSFRARARDGGKSLTYWWSFGDLDFARGRTASHTYGRSGAYHATVWAADRRGNASHRTITVNVP